MKLAWALGLGFRAKAFSRPSGTWVRATFCQEPVATEKAQARKLAPYFVSTSSLADWEANYDMLFGFILVVIYLTDFCARILRCIGSLGDGLLAS